MKRYYVVCGEHRWGPYTFECDANARARMSGGVVEHVEGETTAAERSKAKAAWWELVEALEHKSEGQGEKRGTDQKVGTRGALPVQSESKEG